MRLEAEKEFLLIIAKDCKMAATVNMTHHNNWMSLVLKNGLHSLHKKQEDVKSQQKAIEETLEIRIIPEEEYNEEDDKEKSDKKKQK